MEKIAILLAIYQPRLDWLAEQLRSINEQTYENLELYVYNDCPSDDYDYANFFSQYITRMTYHIRQAEENGGSNVAFEQLTRWALTDNISLMAYSDQDDVWLPHKLSTLTARLQETGGELACSDMYVIDGEGRPVADTITQVYPTQVFSEAHNSFDYALVGNFVTGCTTLVRATLAERALPFPTSGWYYHDWWLAINATSRGKITIVREPLIKYRVHGANQTGIPPLLGVIDKVGYYHANIEKMAASAEVARRLRHEHPEIIDAFCRLAQARSDYYQAPSLKNFYRLWQLQNTKWMKRKKLYFELALPILPTNIVKKLVDLRCRLY